jgi:predicted DNA-binding transcriptional regulator AlpA
MGRQKQHITTPPELVTLPAAAFMASVSPDTFRRLVRERGAPQPVRVRRSVRWRRRELIAWIDAGCPASPTRTGSQKGRALAAGASKEVASGG